MAFTTFSGPVRSGTVREGAARNCGVVVLAQTKVVNFGDAAGSEACIIPAGAQILRATFNTTTTFTAASTIVVSVGGTAINSATTITTGGPYAISITASQAVGQALNVGTSDVAVTYTLSVGASTAGQGTLIIEYIQRTSDGLINPASA